MLRVSSGFQTLENNKTTRPTASWFQMFLAFGNSMKHSLSSLKYSFTSFHCTGRYELNKLTSLPMCGFIAQLIEHRTGIAEVTDSNPVEALIFFFFRLLLSNCSNWRIYCDDHSSLSSTTAVQI